MNEYRVAVRKVVRKLGTVSVQANSEEEAKTKVVDCLESNQLRDIDIAWESPTYEDFYVLKIGEIE